jgi:tagatose 6-phosphate kinase
MILTVTLNPALDVTYLLDRITPGASHRVQQVTEQAGGKGINVSRILHQMGIDTKATGVLGGSTGRTVAQDLARARIAHSFLTEQGKTRRSITIVEHDGTATVLNEPGPGTHIQLSLWARVLDRAIVLGRLSDVVVLSGSLPPWAPPDGYRQLVELIHSLGRPCILDTEGPALMTALPAGPDIIKPNRVELLHATGATDLTTGVDIALQAGARRVVVSDGPDGLTSFDSSSALHVRPPTLSAVNPTGAGDAAVAALAVGLLHGNSAQQSLLRACAWSAAAVLQPVAGMIESTVVAELSAQLTAATPAPANRGPAC